MGQAGDLMFLAWLNRQPAGFAYVDEMPDALKVDLSSLERKGLISFVTSKEPSGHDGYMITPAGRKFQEGD
jgi:hypothetical protein